MAEPVGNSDEISGTEGAALFPGDFFPLPPEGLPVPAFFLERVDELAGQVERCLDVGWFRHLDFLRQNSVTLGGSNDRNIGRQRVMYFFTKTGAEPFAGIERRNWSDAENSVVDTEIFFTYISERNMHVHFLVSCIPPLIHWVVPRDLSNFSIPGEDFHGNDIQTIAFPFPARPDEPCPFDEDQVAEIFDMLSNAVTIVLDDTVTSGAE